MFLVVKLLLLLDFEHPVLLLLLLGLACIGSLAALLGFALLLLTPGLGP